MKDEEKRAVLSTLVAHPGWQLLQEEIRGDMDSALREILQETCTHERRDRLAAQHRVIERLLGWPERELARLENLREEQHG